MRHKDINDAISREDAITEINDTIAGYIPFFDGRTAKIPLELAKAIMRVPPVTQKTGKWLKHSYARKCSECGSVTCWTDDEGTPIPDKYCPNCGAKMEIEEQTE